MKCERYRTKDCYGGKDRFEIRDRSPAGYEDPGNLAMTRAATALESRHYMELTRIVPLNRRKA